MRVFGTLIAGLLFAVAFIVLFLTHAVLAFPQDTEAVVGLLRDADLRGQTVLAVKQQVLKDLSKIPEPALQEVIRENVEGSVDRVLNDTWFYQALGDGHRAFIAYLTDNDTSVTVDLGPLKKNLADFARTTATEAAAQCRKMGEACASAGQLEEGMERFEVEMAALLKKIPDQAAIGTLAEWTGADLSQGGKLNELRENLATAETVRWGALGTAVFLLILVVLINVRSTPRVLVNVGVVLVGASVVYLAVANGGGAMLHDEVAAELAREARADGSDAYRAGEEIANRVGLAGVRALTTYSNPLVYVVLSAGVLLLVGGMVTHRSRRDAAALR